MRLCLLHIRAKEQESGSCKFWSISPLIFTVSEINDMVLLTLQGFSSHIKWEAPEPSHRATDWWGVGWKTYQTFEQPGICLIESLFKFFS